MHNRLCSLLVILLFFCSTFSMEQREITDYKDNKLTEVQKKNLIEKYSATTFKEDLTYFAAVGLAIYKNDPDFANRIKYYQLGQKIEIMKTDGINKKVIKRVSIEYMKHKETIVKRAEFCNYCFLLFGLGIAYLGILEIIKKHLKSYDVAEYDESGIHD